MNKGNFILAIETARRIWSVSLLRDAFEVCFKTGDSLTSGSANLLREISALLDENNLKVKDLEAVAVSAGPGSFTGIRVGLATAQALSFGGKINLAAVPLFEAMAPIAVEKGSAEKGNRAEIVTAMFSGQNQIYWQKFAAGDLGKENRVISVPQLSDQRAFGEMLIAEAEEKDANILLVCDLETREKLHTLALPPGSDIEIIVASDNISKQVGLKYLEQNSSNLQTEKSRRSFVPIYLRDARIGR